MKKYWKSPEEIAPSANLEPLLKTDEFPSPEPDGTSRRDFLKLLGFGVSSAALLNACRQPVEKAIPYLVQPEEVTPGKANYYASSFFEENDFASILVKVRDGRPIKIEGNANSSVSKSGTDARVQASVLGLYDSFRIKQPTHKQEPVTWDFIDESIIRKLELLRENGGFVSMVTPTIISPSTRQVIQQFTTKYPFVNWFQYDAVSAGAIAKAASVSFGIEAIPGYRFDKAAVIASFGADFLGSWLSPIEFIKQYSDAKDVAKGDGSICRHYQFEATMSLTGANADIRLPIEAGDEEVTLLALLNELRASFGLKQFPAPGIKKDLSALVADLLANQGKSLVVCGVNSEVAQLLCNAINSLLGNIGKTIDFTNTLLTHQGDDLQMEGLIRGLKLEEINGVIFWDVNPVYNYPSGEMLGALVDALDFSVCLTSADNETAQHCNYVCPVPHYLEAWNDSEPHPGKYSIAQPCIQPLFDTRMPQESLMRWQGDSGQFRELIQSYWKETIFAQQGRNGTFQEFWVSALQMGGYDIPVQDEVVASYSDERLTEAISHSFARKVNDVLRLQFYQPVAVGTGRFANNPWLQELPDPISRICWDNYASISDQLATDLGIQNEDLIKVNGILLPVFIQPGQAAQTISVALGYGRRVCGKVGEGLGVNVYPMVRLLDGQRNYIVDNVEVVVGGEKAQLAITQTHGNMEGRPIVRETTLGAYQANPSSGNEFHEKAEHHHTTLYDEPEFPAHHWGLIIDLNKCVGCQNCVISCQAENNILVVGKEQVRKRRIMHWMRIDRYYSGSVEQPSVLFQPVMCQHCDNAPCENVCPVAATMHSNEGLNQMAYNRCVGTRYCLNNCPYRVRRFNWYKYTENEKFDFHANDELGRMVLNPDVTVRSRGVIEKCSFCVQRIQEKKLEAKLEGRMLRDGEIQPACVQSCPSGALVFGDLNDPESNVSQGRSNPRNYHLLEEIHTLPSVGYLTKVRNVDHVEEESNRTSKH